MVELKSIELEGKSVLGIELHLPNMVVYLIVDRHSVLCDESFNLAYLVDRNPNSSVMQVQVAHSFEELLSSEITGMSRLAKKRGVKLWMKGKDALENIP